MASSESRTGHMEHESSEVPPPSKLLLSAKAGTVPASEPGVICSKPVCRILVTAFSQVRHVTFRNSSQQRSESVSPADGSFTEQVSFWLLVGTFPARFSAEIPITLAYIFVVFLRPEQYPKLRLLYVFFFSY
jgi:hypothetical protein